jgi:hypothetical protein
VTLVIDSEMPSGVAFNLFSGAGGAATPITFNFNNIGGKLLYGFYGLGIPSASTIAFGTVTYDGVSMTSVLEDTTSGGSTGGRLGVFRLLNPSIGNKVVSVPFSGTGAVIDFWAGMISFNGHDTSAPEKQLHNTRGSSTTPADSLSGVLSSSIVIGCAGGGTAFTATTQTVTFGVDSSNGDSLGNGRGTKSTSPGSVTHSYTMGASDTWIAVMLEVAAAADLSVFRPHRMPMGV